MDNNAMLNVEQVGDTIVITPSRNLSELAFEQIEEDAEQAWKLLDGGQAKNAVWDFCHTDYYGSTALSYFVKFWKKIRIGGGKMAFCNLSEHEREILQITSLDTLWAIFETREEALKYVSE